MEALLVSACLLGAPCRYDGKSKPNPKIPLLLDKYSVIPVCPEVLGGLPTPRLPSERVGERVLMRDGSDVTDNFKRGANEALQLCRLHNCKKALLKKNSPSCSNRAVYDGSFSGTLREGLGVTAELLLENGIEVFSEDEIDSLLLVGLIRTP